MKLIKEIKSKSGKIHFRRWELLKTPWFSIWIHGIYAADDDLHQHNHPWDFCSLILKGTYIEQTTERQNFDNSKGEYRVDFRDYTVNNKMSPGTFSKRDGAKYHKIKELKTPAVYTLFIASPVKREWGYNVDGKFIQHEEYRKLKREGKI